MTDREETKRPTKPARVSTNDETDELIFAVCEKFFKQMEPGESGDKKRKGAAAAVAEWLAEERDRPDLNREKIYPLVWEAFRRDFLLMRAPVENKLRDALIARFGLSDFLAQKGGKLVVVNVAGPTASQHVSKIAADEIIDLIYQVGAEKKERAIRKGRDPEQERVHLGFGTGYAAMEVAKRLSERADANTPKLTLHAISPGGFYIEEQQKDASTYFNYFADKGIDVRCVGFFSTPVVWNDSFDRLKTNPSLRQCFDRRDEIDIIATSLASASDEHGLFRKYFQYLKREKLIEEDVIRTMEEENWVGDLLFHPYSAKKPLCPKTIRPVALFAYEELVEFSRKPGKRVVVIGGPCGECGTPKTEALRPLFQEPSMRLWTTLVLDRKTAVELLRVEPNANPFQPCLNGEGA